MMVRSGLLGYKKLETSKTSPGLAEPDYYKINNQGARLSYYEAFWNRIDGRDVPLFYGFSWFPIRVVG